MLATNPAVWLLQPTQLLGTSLWFGWICPGWPPPPLNAKLHFKQTTLNLTQPASVRGDVCPGRPPTHHLLYCTTHLILGTSLWLGKMSAQAGHRRHPGFSTRMPLRKGECSTAPARPGVCAAR